MTKATNPETPEQASADIIFVDDNEREGIQITPTDEYDKIEWQTKDGERHSAHGVLITTLKLTINKEWKAERQKKKKSNI